MDKNKYFVEEPDNTDNISKEGSDRGLFINRVASSGTVFKFKVRKNGAFLTSSNVLTHEHTFSEKQNASGPLVNTWKVIQNTQACGTHRCFTWER
jgi:hypothetical protein